MLCPLIPSSDPCICPERWVARMIKIIPAHASEPFFLVRENRDRFPLTSRQVGRLLKQWCKSAGLDLARLTPHGLRRGGLTWAHRAKVSSESLQVLGGWASNAYKRYIEHDFESRLETGKKMAQMEL